MEDIPRALFEVGEIAILQTIHFNGECTILSRSRQELISGAKHWFYVTTLNFPGDSKTSWIEYSLRKKHKPGDSYDQLIANLKNPSYVGVPA